MIGGRVLNTSALLAFACGTSIYAAATVRIITEPARDEALARLRAEMRRETGTRDE